MTHMLRLLSKFSRAGDAVYPSSLKAACFGLSVPSKLTVVLFSGHSGFFPQGKNRLDSDTKTKVFIVNSPVDANTWNQAGIFSINGKLIEVVEECTHLGIKRDSVSNSEQN